ncbi:hypothetical protein GCM10025865_32900 [Paraoerskovia sediminicola]|uniref:Peptide chain release factor 1 (ERF1) n=1 Tax=Paraoerskovia sediminicola TaxID=1138587 RepID=A0ABM8G750_9CELL|nr:hypothetical protein [Paraoerskovia sediminicola]BDZ40722.1 hypothetical protein GCM10025865_00210 [Paraoerskovia sediminicola]BDZ43991.1 hypothetical protein GCM10025865_32900 [Paraoerskovia sediminicola]
MKIDWLKPLLGHDGPFATVFLDATGGADAGDREVENRWRSARRALVKEGAPDAVLASIEDAVLRPTGVRGPHGRFLVANDEGVLVDRLVRTPPSVQQGTYGPVPVLIQAAKAADESVSRVIVTVDRQGADIEWITAGGLDIGALTVEGDHDEVSKAQAGRMQQRRVEGRAEDSWERNAETVAAVVDRVAGEHQPEVVLMTGDKQALRLVHAALGKAVAPLVREIPGGARGNGVNRGALDAHIAEALEAVRAERRDAVLADLAEGQGRGSGGVSSLPDVAAVLARGQVRELVITEAFVAAAQAEPRHLWVGPEPLQIGTSRDAIVALGATDEIHEYPAGVAMVRAALGQDAGLTYAPDGTVDLKDGVGAVLRWSDDETPSESTATMSGDNHRLHGAV